MTLQINHISDGQLLLMIGRNDVKAWEHLYDKHAAAMYSIVCQFTDSKELANEIFTDAFLQLREKNILLKIHYALCPFLLRYMHNFTDQHFKKLGISALQNSKVANSQLIHMLCSQCNSIKDAAFKLNITEAAVVKNLQSEFFALRKKNV